MDTHLRDKVAELVGEYSYKSGNREAEKLGIADDIIELVASKFIELLPHKKSPTLGWRKWNRARATGWNAAIDKTERAIKELWDV